MAIEARNGKSNLGIYARQRVHQSLRDAVENQLVNDAASAADDSGPNAFSRSGFSRSRGSVVDAASSAVRDYLLNTDDDALADFAARLQAFGKV